MITITPAQTSQPLRRPWKNGIAVGRAYDLTRADLLEHLRWLQREVGFRSCRFHGVFHDDMAVVRRSRDGSLVYQWHHVDKVYDALLELGLKPFVELNPMPAALASGSQTMFYYAMNVTPPKVWEEWGGLVRAFTLHCLERYGLDEVRQWHFEVWNEPNLSAFWSGTKKEYFELYAHAARAVKSVAPQLRVGGPATSKAYWLADLIAHCHKENIPLDFISTHLYPQDEFVEFENRAASPYAPGAFFAETVRRAKAAVAASAMPDLPVHWTEWNTQLATTAGDVTWGENRYVDSIHGGSFAVRNMIELDDAADTFTFWVASDIFEEGPIPNAPFSRTYGMLTIHGIPKATANAFRFLERMRGVRMDFIPSASLPDFCGGVATREGESVHLLLWNDAPPEVDQPASWSDSLSWAVQSDAPHVAVCSHVKRGAGSAFETWESIGCPLNPSPVQQALLRAAAEPCMAGELLCPRDGKIEMPFTLGANEFLHVEIRRMGAAASVLRAELSPEESHLIEAQLGEKSRD
jgi:xylan 1,4-beta-xylosidase